ncbi:MULTISPECIES: hypothetical protein [unclassified Lysobacter]|uniref:hypothetical protein n=1 Tax=unclassified Lysobacter TaxID=2635362 RepID=UPI000B07E229|nr:MULTISPECIES: hypothetical protein [unclassified Lysobacter]
MTQPPRSPTMRVLIALFVIALIGLAALVFLSAWEIALVLVVLAAIMWSFGALSDLLPLSSATRAHRAAAGARAALPHLQVPRLVLARRGHRIGQGLAGVFQRPLCLERFLAAAGIHAGRRYRYAGVALQVFRTRARDLSLFFDPAFHERSLPDATRSTLTDAMGRPRMNAASMRMR